MTEYFPAPVNRTDLIPLYAVDNITDSIPLDAVDNKTDSIPLNAVDNKPSSDADASLGNEAKFFRVVEAGDLQSIQSILDNTNQPINVNAINSEGRTALYIAVKSKREDIVGELLEKGADPRNALLWLVFENDLELAKLILLTEGAETKENSEHSCSYITPITLAAQLGYHEMVQLLLEYGHKIEDPRKNGRQCDKCRKQPEMSRSQIAFKSFRGLSSPDYICYQYIIDQCGEKDLLRRAFELNKVLERRAEDEPELKKEYLKLSERCRRFSIDLYNECRSFREVCALWDIDEDDLKDTGDKPTPATVTETFRAAIENTQEEFIAHPHTQQLLNTVVYAGIPEWPRRYWFFACFLYTLCFPAMVPIYIVFPKHKISRILSSPFVKFVSHTSQFVIFLALLAASSLRNNHVPTGLEYLIFIFILGMIVQEIAKILRHRHRRSYFFKWWNIVTTIMLILFVLAFLFWLLGFAITGSWSVVELSGLKLKAKTGHHFLLLGNSCFSLAIAVSVFHLLDLCQISSVLGPLQLSLYRMLRDVLKFLLIFFGIFMAFAFGVRNLYSYYNSVIDAINDQYERQNDTEHLVTEDHPLSTFEESTRSLFWALFDKIDLEDFDTKDHTFSVTQVTGKLLYAFYSICAVMVALNMLIAMMTHSFDKISQDEDIQWKFSRTQLLLEFIEKGSTLPSPYNLIPNPKLIYRFFKNRKIPSRNDSPSSVGDSSVRIKEAESLVSPGQDSSYKIKEAERKKVVECLIRRYFSRRESQSNRELSTVKNVEDCKSEIIKVLKEERLKL